ncbi:MAG: HAD-IIIC family phosphatase [Lentisphaerae bacterium]|nr:HAD-IIIC family phosphatase [Lentisphaerota bacterium]
MSTMGLSYSEIQDFLNQADLSKLPSLRIAVLRNIMVEPVEPYLRYLAYQMGFQAQVAFGDYDNIYQEAVGGQGNLLGPDTDYVLVFTKLETLSPTLARSYTLVDSERIQAETERIRDYVDNVLSGIRRQTNAVILWHGFELCIYPALGIMDSQSPDGQNAAVGSLNEMLKSSLRNAGNAYFVDLTLCLARLGAAQFYDHRYWHIGRAPFTRQALREIAGEDLKFVRALKGKVKKCLALDCDGVLWGGVIGEDGLAGIGLGQTHPGSAYYELQQEILSLYHRGIILALCSKNNEEDVWEVFRRHPDMILKEEHIATSQVNWRDKAANLRQIAQDLNIGLDSLVFLDDSDFEVNLIRQVLPEVEVLHLAPARATEYRSILAACGLFDTLTLSTEDRKRGAMYKAEVARKQLQGHATSMEDYLKALEMVLEVRLADEFTIGRIAQLTQKTNQFNLTTKRYSEDDIRSLAGSSRSNVMYVKVSDRFGEYGIVGVCILKYEDRRATLDTFLLSCRVLGRGVEDAFLAEALSLARARGFEIARGEYCATQKNGQVADFYVKRGFEASKNETESERQVFECKLSDETNHEPSFFKQIVSEIDT